MILISTLLLSRIIIHIRDIKLNGNVSYLQRRKFNDNLNLITIIEENTNLLNANLYSYIQIKKLSTSDRYFSSLRKEREIENIS